MRTTLTIDDATGRKLKQLAHDTGKTFKQVVNETLRRGLAASEQIEAGKPYRLKPVSLGEVAPDYNLDKALALAEQLEDEELVRKQRQRK
jgi:hypothetical protein